SSRWAVEGATSRCSAAALTVSVSPWRSSSTRRSARSTDSSGGDDEVPITASLRREPEQPGGVVLHDQRLYLVLDLQLGEVGQPPVRGDQGIVGAEQHLPFEQPARLTDELRREVLGRPAAEVD